MADWPTDLKAHPIQHWPGELTRNRMPSKFKASFGDTLQLLDREVWHLAETRSQQESLEFLIAIPAGSDSWRIDGRPRASAVPEHPGVIVSLDSKFGHLSYPCDRFLTWRDNLRAIALSLEALRKVDRYGVTKRGEQYRGFLAIESSTVSAEFSSPEEALHWLERFLGVAHGQGAHRVLRAAQRAAHPDNGGTVEDFRMVALAEAKLRSGGLL